MFWKGWVVFRRIMFTVDIPFFSSKRHHLEPKKHKCWKSGGVEGNWDWLIPHHHPGIKPIYHCHKVSE